MSKPTNKYAFLAKMIESQILFTDTWFLENNSLLIRKQYFACGVKAKYAYISNTMLKLRNRDMTLNEQPMEVLTTNQVIDILKQHFAETDK